MNLIPKWRHWQFVEMLLMFLMLAGLGMVRDAASDTGRRQASEQAILLPQELYFNFQNDLVMGSGIGRMDRSGKVGVVRNGYPHVQGLAFDKAGNLYFGSEVSDQVMDLFRLKPDGTVQNLGNLYRADGQTMSWSFELAVSPQDEVYFNFHRDLVKGGGIGKMDRNGKFSVVRSGIAHADGLAFDKAGNLYFGSEVSDLVMDLLRLKPDGSLQNLGNLYRASGQSLSWSFDVAVSPQDEVYFNFQHDLVKGSGIGKMDRNGKVSVVRSGIAHAVGLAFDPAGNLYFGSDDGSNVFDLYRLKPDGTMQNLGNLSRAGAQSVSWSFALAFGKPSPVRLLSPNGGETFVGNSMIPISWETDVAIAGTTVKLELIDSRGGVTLLGTGSNAAGKETRNVYLPFMPERSDYRIRVTSNLAPALMTASLNPFSITGWPIQLITPGGGETWRVGSTQSIHWKANTTFTGRDVRFELWGGGHRLAILGTASDADGDGQSQITVPVVPAGDRHVVRVVSVLNQKYVADSKGLITIGDIAIENAIPGKDWRLYQ